MAPDAVAEVDRPGQGGGRAVGHVGQAGEEAAPAPHRHAEREGADEERARRAADAARELVELHPHDGADERADDAVG